MQAEAAAPSITPSPKRTSVVHAWITDAMFLALTAEAERRRVHPDRLTAQILEGVLRNDLVGFLDQPEFA